MPSFKRLLKTLKLSNTVVGNNLTAIDKFRKYISGEAGKTKRKPTAVEFYSPLGVYSFTDCDFPFYTTVPITSYRIVGELIPDTKILNWVEYDKALIQPGFKSAKIILTAEGFKISRPSQITGIYYQTKYFRSYTLPFGRPENQQIDFWEYVRNVILESVDKEKFRVRIKPEAHPKC